MQSHEWRLLQEYRRNGSEQSFVRLTECHFKLIYSTCFRELRDRCLSEDATQAVLLIFVRKAHTFGPETKLAGWFFQAARYVSRNIMRQEARRRMIEEQVSIESRVIDRQDVANAIQIEPWIDSALECLGPKDREAILLRFYENRSMQEIGDALGATEDAAKMRVSRAVDKLRRRLSRNAVFISGTALGAALLLIAANGVDACSRQSMENAIRAALGQANNVLPPTRPYQIAQGAMKAMFKTKIIVTLAVAGLSLIGTSATMMATANANGRSEKTTHQSNANSIQTNETSRFGSRYSTGGRLTASVKAHRAAVAKKLGSAAKSAAPIYWVCDVCKCFYTPTQAKSLDYKEGMNGHKLVRESKVPAGYSAAVMMTPQ